MKIDFSTLAEVDLMDLNLADLEDQIVGQWLQETATFKHTDAYEYILHLYLDETEEWFIKNRLNHKLPDSVINIVLQARNKGAARICFYS